MSIRVLFVFIVVFFLIACQPVSVATPPAGPTELPGEIPHPTITATSAPTTSQTAVPTPTVSPAELKRRAGPVCENAFSTLVESGPLAPPFAVLKKMNYADIPLWEVAHPLPHLGSFSAAEVQTMFCISETRTQTGTYTDGSAAYQFFWEVRAIAWPGGKVIKKNSFTGPPPPKTSASSAGSAEELFPYQQFAAWVFSQVDHPDFLYFTDAITSLVLSPDGGLAAFGTALANQTVDRNYQAKIFLFNPSDLQTDAGTSAFLNALPGHQGMVTSLAFSPDGRILASGGFDLFVKFWDPAAGRLIGQLKLEDAPNSIAFSADGTQMAVTTNLDTVFVDPISMQVTRSIEAAGGNHLAFSPENNYVYVNSVGNIKLIDVRASRVTLKFPDPFALAPTLSVSEEGTSIVTYESPVSVEGFALSPDGTYILTYTVERSLEQSPGAGTIRLAAWDAKTGKFKSEVKFSGGPIGTIQFSPNGEALAMSNDNALWLWDTTNWQVKETFMGHVEHIVDLAFTAEGTKILSASGDGTVRVWAMDS